MIYEQAGGERVIALMRWGFKTHDRLLFNARSETIASTGFWKESFLKRRCLVPADGFYEWSKGSGRNRAKYVFTVPGRKPFGMAGVWSSWKNPKTGECEPTFAVLTGEANGVMQAIHDRQPTIPDSRDYQEWLSASERPPIHLIRLLPDEGLQVERVESVGRETRRQEELFTCQGTEPEF